MKLKINAKKLLITLGLFLSICAVWSQKAPMKYGKVDQADLEMKVYPADSSASAVLLCNYGYFDSNQLQFIHQMRFKILTEEGKNYLLNLTIPADEKTTVKGQTVNLENGVPVITKLSKDGIFIERVTRNNYRARVAMPNVKVGSVVDIEFYFKGLPAYWSFQQSIPVRWSELILEESTYFSFRKNFTGYTSLSEASNDRWVAKEVPAFKSEPYINNYENYLTRFIIELSSIHIPGYLYKDYATSWEAVAKTLRDDDDFGGQFSSINFSLNGIEKEIKNSSTTPEDRLSKAYDAIKKIKWNKEESIWATKTGLSYAYNKKIGNVADINLNLVLLLRKLGLDANPMVLSTRSNGILPPFSVSLDKLNYVLAYVVIGEKSYILDATDDNLPLGLLPKRAINGRGLVIKKEDIAWVDLTPQKKEKSVSIMNLTLTPDGTMKGKWTKSTYDYAALDQRKHYKTFNSEDEYLKSIETKHIGLSIDHYSLKGMDSIQQPLNEEFTIVLKNKVTKANNQFYINPNTFNQYVENPFKAQDRVYPVDFTTPIEETHIFMLDLPEGFTIDQLPKNMKVSLPDNTASFQMLSSATDNKIQVLFKLYINKAVFYQPEYQNLKAFFDELVKKQAEMLIIKKI
ncbi:MAG: hypothetical protein P4L34_02630 [Paludibacter sp.]|nr:hypothetical protein [Paludibacter sp.]